MVILARLLYASIMQQQHKVWNGQPCGLGAQRWDSCTSIDHFGICFGRRGAEMVGVADTRLDGTVC